MCACRALCTDPHLNPGSDELSHLPTDLFPGLTRLRRLVLNHNDISLLSSGVAQLASLEVLELEDNRLNVLPWQVGNMPNLKVLKLDGNPLTKVPLEVARSKGNLQIWQRYLVGLKARMDESYRMKMVLVGDHALDKACLLQSIADYVRPGYDRPNHLLPGLRALF